MTDSIYLAHLSDLHIPLDLPRGREWLSKRGLSGLSWRRRRRHHRIDVAKTLREDLLSKNPDVIAMGGDLINFGLEREFERSRLWLESFGNSDHVVAIPGNHEAMMAGWQQHMKQHWGPYLSLNENDGGATLQRFGPVGLIAVSTAVATLPFLASGRVGERQLDTIANLLEQARRDNLCPVVVMHHPPTRITPRRRGLSDYQAVCATLAKGGAALVLHGHTHKSELSWINAPHGTIPVLGVPSFSMYASSRKSPGAWRMIRITISSTDWVAEITERKITESGMVHPLTPVMVRLPSTRGVLADAASMTTKEATTAKM